MVSADVVVVGGAVVDTIHRAESQRGASLYGTSTPCRVHYSHGGVGRNIAEALARLGVSVKLVSVVGDEPTKTGLALRDDCAALGIDVTAVKVVPNATTASYTAILDADGELSVASAAMHIFEEHLRPDFVLAELPSILKAQFLVIDGNVPRATVTALAKAVAEHRATTKSSTPRIAVDPISRIKLRNFLDVLPSIDIFKPNHYELAELCQQLDGFPPLQRPMQSGDAEVEAARTTLHCKLLCLKLVERFPNLLVLCTLGRNGCVVGRRAGASPRWEVGDERIALPYGSTTRVSSGAEVRWFRATPVPASQVRKVTGAGDSFLSGFLFASLCAADPSLEWSVERQVKVARNSATLALQSQRTISLKLSKEALFKGVFDNAGKKGEPKSAKSKL